MKEAKDLHRKGHPGRPDLIGEHKAGDAGQIILLIVFLATWITDSFLFKYSIFLADYVPLAARLGSGILVLILSWLLARSGLRVIFREQRDKPELIKEGVFARIRHPIYLGAILLYLGLILITFSLISAGLWLAIILFYIFISRYEERLLIAHFGEEYNEYKKQVPMLFPKLF